MSFTVGGRGTGGLLVYTSFLGTLGGRAVNLMSGLSPLLSDELILLKGLCVRLMVEND